MYPNLYVHSWALRGFKIFHPVSARSQWLCSLWGWILRSGIIVSSWVDKNLHFTALVMTQLHLTEPSSVLGASAFSKTQLDRWASCEPEVQNAVIALSDRANGGLSPSTLPGSGQALWQHLGGVLQTSRGRASQSGRGLQEDRDKEQLSRSFIWSVLHLCSSWHSAQSHAQSRGLIKYLWSEWVYRRHSCFWKNESKRTFLPQLERSQLSTCFFFFFF